MAASKSLSETAAYSLLQTLEVATARVYNWDVTMKRKEKADSGRMGTEKRRVCLMADQTVS